MLGLSSIRAKLRLSLWTFAIAIALLVALGSVAVSALASVRAFVGGESLWAKGQKDAVYNLVQYSYSANERDYEAYVAFLRVPLADRRARLELEKPNADLEVADRAFIEGGNHPEDVRGMSLLFRRFRRVSYIDRAISIWAQGDAAIEELQSYGTTLHNQIRSGTLTDVRRTDLLRRIDDVNRRLTELENRFTDTLGEAARFLRLVILIATLLFAGICLLVTLSLLSSTTRRIVRGIRDLHEGTERVGKAELRERISDPSSDELGQLARDFNRMTDSLVRAHQERASAEQALSQRAVELEHANELLVEAQAIGRIGSWEWDLETNRVSWSDELYRIYGQTPHSFAANYQGFLDHVHPDDRDRVEAIVNDARARGTSFEFEHRIIHLSGETRWVHGQGKVIANASGKIERMVGTSLDITDRVRADDARVRILTERAARKSAEADRMRAELLAEASARIAGSIDYSATARAIAELAVPRFADLCVVRFADTLADGGKPLEEVIVHGDPDMVAHLAELRRRFPHTDSAPQGVAHVMKTGVASWIPFVDDSMYTGMAETDEHHHMLSKSQIRSVVVAPMLAHSETLGAIAFALCGPSRQYTEADLSLGEELGRRAGLAIDNARSHRVARQAIAARDEFLSIASHELRTPLTPLQLELESIRALVSPLEGTGKLTRKLETAERQVRRIARLIDGLLDVSRLSAGQLKLEFEETDLVVTVRDVCERFAAEAKAQKVTVEIENDGDVRGTWDAVRVDQVVVNLLTNAIKYGAGGRVVIRVWQDPTDAYLTVRDEGIGVPAAELERIFERYERAVSSRAYGGLGLGLYITKELVGAHGGKVWATRNPDAGSTFHIKLPKKRAAVHASAEAT